jgi:arabinose-5-phosphate isomerase
MATVNRGAAREGTINRKQALAVGRDVIEQEALALRSLASALGEEFVEAVNLILDTRQRVIVTGIGKSGHIGRKAAATLASTGTPAFFIHAAEAAHGDLGMLGAQDTLIVISNSGFTREIRPLLSYARRLGTRVIGIASTRNSPLGRQADVLLELPKAEEACPARIAPTTSTTMMLALCDALAIAVMRERSIQRDDLARLHPGGDIGYRLSPVDELIDSNVPLPLVREDAPLRDVVLEMTSVGKGIAGVVDRDGLLLGVITDGDLRRSFDQVLIARAADVMTRTPITVPSGTTIGDVHSLMMDTKITVVFVMDREKERHPIGLIHIHDLATAS